MTTEKTGPMTLFFGCRTRPLDLYMEEKEAMRRAGVLTHTYLALSREPKLPKVMCLLSWLVFVPSVLIPDLPVIPLGIECHDVIMYTSDSRLGTSVISVQYIYLLQE